MFYSGGAFQVHVHYHLLAVASGTNLHVNHGINAKDSVTLLFWHQDDMGMIRAAHTYPSAEVLGVSLYCWCARL